MRGGLTKTCFLSIILLLTIQLFATGDGDSIYGRNTGAESSYELSIFVIPSYRPIDWSSPSLLIKSTVNSYMEASFNKKLYPIGHLFIELINPEGDLLIRTSIASSRPAEQRKMVLADKIGLAMLGAPVAGKMESQDELARQIDKFARRGKISFISYKIKPEAAERVIEYVKIFSSRDSLGRSPSDRYGGSFWPRFKGEGSGCSAFGMAALQLTGVNIDNPEWYIEVDVPFDLVGGVYNNGVKVRPMSVLKRKEWHNGEGEEWKTHFTHFIYDPSYIYEWIKRRLSGKDPLEGFSKSYKRSASGRIFEGLEIDATGLDTPKDPIFKSRERPSLFVD